MSNNVNFSYQDKSYEVSLKPIGDSSDKAVIVNGKAYQILGSQESIEIFKSQFEKLGTTNFHSFEALESSLKNIGKPEGSKQEKTDSVFQKTIRIEEKNELKIDIPGTIKEIGEKLEKIYIYPETAKKCSEYLQVQMKQGAYDKFSDLKSFADAVSSDIFKIANDKHMVFDLKWVPEMSNSFDANNNKIYPIPELEKEAFEYKSDFTGHSYELKAGLLKEDKNIGYIDLRTFGICKTGDDDEIAVQIAGAERKNAYIQAANNIKAAKSIIVDMRNNGGGTPNGVQLLCSLFMEEEKHLDSIVERKENTYTTYPWDTLNYEELPKEMRLLDRNVVVLISKSTFSAAESFTNSMQVLGQATIVGEKSGGGANPRAYYEIGEDFDIGIPHGRAFNPNRKDESNWEGVGIKPDHAVPAEDALKTAIALSKK